GHWADEATLDVLRLLGRRAEELPALIVVTYRDDEITSRHPLLVVLGELATARGIARLTLQRLSRDAVAELAGDRPIDVSELYEKTGGNPFFVTEVLAAAGTSLPDTVREAVLARARRLSPPARRL